MNRKEIRERVEVALQDVENRHWSDREINQFIDDALVEFTRIARYPQVEGTATNPGSSASLGEATKTATLSVDGKTATLSNFGGSGAAHGYSDNDVLIISAGSPSEYNGPFNILVPSTTTVTYQVDFGNSVTGASVSVFRMGPAFTKPSTIAEITSASIDGRELSIYTESEITSVSIDGRELAIYTESEMNAAASSRGQRHFMLESSMGFHPNPFSFAFNTVQNTPRWRDQIGPIEAVVFNNRTADTFRIYPLPKENRDLYVDKDATTKVFQKLTVRGVPVVTGLSSDTSSPTVNSYWHEAMVFGALERVWLKESKVQNVEKSQMYRAKFLEQAMSAQKMEGMSSGAISEGRNQGGFRINRSL